MDSLLFPENSLITMYILLQVDPLQRYSAYEILEHPWIRALG